MICDEWNLLSSNISIQRDVSGRHKRVVGGAPSQENASLSCHNLQDSSRIIESKPGSRCKGSQRRMAMPKKETRITPSTGTTYKREQIYQQFVLVSDVTNNNAFIPLDIQSSKLHVDVVHELVDKGLQLREEVLLSSGYRLGALVQNMDPSHFFVVLDLQMAARYEA